MQHYAENNVARGRIIIGAALVSVVSVVPANLRTISPWLNGNQRGKLSTEPGCLRRISMTMPDYIQYMWRDSGDCGRR